MTPNEVLFMIFDCPDEGPMICATPVAYWEEHECMCDEYNEDIYTLMRNEGFIDLADWTFEIPPDRLLDSVVYDLRAMGFKEDLAFTAFMNGCFGI